MTRLGWGCVALSLTVSCAEVKAELEPENRQIGSATAALAVAARGDGVEAEALLANVPDEEDAVLRRAYGAADMKVHACVSREDDGTFTGKQCPAAVVVFGPYVTVPSSSDVHFRFDIRPSKTLTIGSDVLSDAARQFHGAVEAQVVPANEVRTVNYRIHLFDAARTLETRIGVQGEGVADFEISNLSMTIR